MSSVVLQLRPLEPADLQTLVTRAVAAPQGLGGRITLSEEATEAIVRLAAGDARRALTTLEAATRGVGTGRARVEEGFRAYFRFAAEDRTSFLLLLGADNRAEPEFARPARDVALLRHAALIGRDAVRTLGHNVLNRNLHVIEPDLGEALAMAGVGLAVVGALCTAFLGPRIGLPLLACGALMGSVPMIYGSPWFSYVLGGTLAFCSVMLGWWVWDKVRDSVNASDNGPKEG